MIYTVPHRELVQMARLRVGRGRMDAELREHGVDPSSLQGRYGSVGSERQGDEAWQRALGELHRLHEQRGMPNPRMN